MARIALALAAASAISLSVPAAAAVTLTGYTVSGPSPANGSFTLQYDDVAQVYTLIALDFTVGTTHFDISNSGIEQFSLTDVELGGNPDGVTGLQTSLNLDDFALEFDPTRASQTQDFFYLFGGTNEIPNVPVTITASVPEPASWAMMLLGFGAIAFALRRRRIPAHA